MFVLIVAGGWLLGGFDYTVPELDGRRTLGGIRVDPSYFALLFALVVYTASHIAEIVRGSIQAVPIGQGEAADALGLLGFPAHVVRGPPPVVPHRHPAAR